VEHGEYLEVMLKDKNLKLEQLREEHRIAIAVYKAKSEMLISERDSIEKQLKNHKER
jgi:hypothetical protein